MAELNIRVIDESGDDLPAPPEAAVAAGSTAPVQASTAPQMATTAPPIQAAAASTTAPEPARPSKSETGSTEEWASTAPSVGTVEGLVALGKQLGFGKWIEAAERMTDAAKLIMEAVVASQGFFAWDKFRDHAEAASTAPPEAETPRSQVTSAPLPEEEFVTPELVDRPPGLPAPTGLSPHVQAPTAAAGEAEVEQLVGGKWQTIGTTPWAAGAASSATTAVATRAATAAGASAAAGGSTVMGGAAAAAGATGAGTASAMAALAAATGPVAIGLAAVAGATGLAYAAVQKFADAMEQQATTLADWSVELSSALAESEIKMMRAEMERAERLEKPLASFEDKKADMDVAIYQLGTEIKLAFVQIVEPMLPLIRDVAKGMAAVVGTVNDVLPFVKTVLLQLLPAQLRLVALAQWQQGHLQEQADRETEEFAHPDVFAEQFLRMALEIPIKRGEKAPIGLPPGVVGGPAIQP